MNSPKIIAIQPSIENCDPIKKYQKSTPVQYALQEIPILYGGGRKWIMSCPNPELLSSIAEQQIIPQDNELLVDLFVLNTSLIIWFNDLSKGLEISYLDIPAHALRKNQSNQLELYIQINVSHQDELLELSFSPKYWENDRYFNKEIEKLFTYEYFGLNKGTKMIFNTFNSIGKCSCFHSNDDENQDDYDEADIISTDNNDEEILEDFYENGLDNSGNADDMNDVNRDCETGAINWNSGISVKIYDDEKNKTRSREELGILSQETNEPNKRLRC